MIGQGRSISRTLLQALTGDAEIEALFSDQADIRAILRFEVEFAVAEAECGLVVAEAASAIQRACDAFAPDWTALADGVARDGVVLPALLAQLRAKLDPAYRSALHRGATSQDAIDTSLVLRLAEVIQILDSRISAIVEAFADLSAVAGDRSLLGRTRMQQALPISWKYKIATWKRPLERLREALSDMKPRVLLVQLGGPVGNRASFGGKGDEVARRLAERLGLAAAPSWHPQRDGLVEFGSLMARISGVLGKFGADICLLSQNEIAAVALSDGGGSSSMGHKSNPVRAEVLVALASRAAGLAGTLHHALVHENERSGAAWTLEWLTLPDLVIGAGASLRLARELQERMTING